MNLKTRLLKLEKALDPEGLVLIAVDDGESNEQALKRYFPDGRKPKQVVYLSPLDLLA